MEKLAHDAVSHGGIRPVLHPTLGRQIAGQTALRTLRFRWPVRIDHLSLPLVRAGRWVPAVPTHPAHLIISVPERGGGCWRVVRDVDLPPDPRITGAGLNQDMTVDEMVAHLDRALNEVCHQIDLGGIQTDCLRVECDREHPVWPNHGECNGARYMVPFGILSGLAAHGTATQVNPVQAVRGELLTIDQVAPTAPAGMRVRDLPHMVLYESDHLAIGFSLRRPILMHLGWDAWGQGGARRNRLSLQRKHVGQVGGLSGPLLRGLDVDTAAHLWTGSVAVAGNRVCYRVHPAALGIEIHATFTIHADRVELDLVQHGATDLPMLEAEAWRLAWDLHAGMTSTAGLPTLAPGRNGDVQFPAFFATDGQGALACRLLDGDADTTRLQTESYRPADIRTDGLVLAPRPALGACLTLPAGTRHATIELAVDAFQPDTPAASRLPSGVERHWGSIFACFRPELGGFSNHAASVNCHVNQWAPVELVAHTRRPQRGPDPLQLARFTIARALLDGGGYGYHRDLYLDSDPILLAMAGRLHQAEPDVDWLGEVEPGLRAAHERITSHLDPQGLVVCRALSGNTGSFRWSCNAMDVVGFGHLDAYVNAWSYRALRNVAVLLRDLDDHAGSRAANHRADQLRHAFAPAFLNPATGWVAGWRSRDGQLHDAAYLWVNGPAIAFGLLDPPQARAALAALEALRHHIGLGSARLGLPCNLLPIPPGDQMIQVYPGAAAGQPSFELYTDGGLSGSAGYYLRALATYGFQHQADTLADELDQGYANDVFTGPIGAGQEFLSWDGLRTGYEGTLIVRLDSLDAIAIQKGLLQSFDPPWWPG